MSKMTIRMATNTNRLLTWEFQTDMHIPKLVNAIKENEPDWEQITITIIRGEQPNHQRRAAEMKYAVYVDNVFKGEVYKWHNRWHWRRGPIAVESFAKGSTLEDVAEWARKCCLGNIADVRKENK